MCGIACIFNIKKQSAELREKALCMARKIRHRGPDWSGIHVGPSAILAHERLSIVDPQSGGQPLYSPDARQILAIDDPNVQQHLLDEIIKNKWSVARAEQFVIGYKAGGSAGKNSVGEAKRATRSETDLTRNIAKKLGFKSKLVTQKTTAHGGQIIIKYRTDEDIEKITKALGL